MCNCTELGTHWLENLLVKVKLMLTQDQVSCSFSYLFWKYLTYRDDAASLGDLFRGCVKPRQFQCIPVTLRGNQLLLLDYYYSIIMQHSLVLFFFLQREGSKPFIEGILSIFWGVRHPIRLKIQDEKQIPSFVTLKSTENVGLFPGKR